MNEESIQEQLHREGFKNIMNRRDPPGLFYPDHIHNLLTAHIVLEGEMTLIVDGRVVVLHQGERFDVPANAIHSAQVGDAGCHFFVGEK